MSHQNNRREKASLIKKARWAGYAAAGAATAVAGHEAAEGAITYKNPADVTIDAAVTTASTQSSLGFFDLNMDGEDDLAFQHLGILIPGSSTVFGGYVPGTALGAAFAIPLSNTFGSNNAVGGFIGPFLGYGTQGTPIGSYPYVYNMPIGDPVSASTPNFIAGGTLAFTDVLGYSEFTAAEDGYVSVRFDSAAGTHFGWVRVGMSGTPLNAITVKDWAYGMPGQRILVGQIPEPGSLGLLALGATGLLAWRRRRGEAALERAQQNDNDD